MFTEIEKTILNALPEEYKYIYRFPDGALYVGKTFSKQDYHTFRIFNHLFKDVKAGAKPICFRKPILDDTEREYLKAVFKPFHQNVRYVKKVNHDGGRRVYITAKVNDDGMIFPDFKAGKMYIGMKLNKEYSLEELGITYD